jgi:TRAP-type C4-dicarboxylate transport system substrate-binding protein
MDFKIDRRSALKAGAALAALDVVPAWAQDKPKLRFAAVFSDKDIRADMMKSFAKDIEADFTVETYLGGTLFKQGTELVALQRDNLELGNIAPQDISKQIPAWSILTSAYLFRDANHLNAFFASDLGGEMKKMVEDQVKVKIRGRRFSALAGLGEAKKKGSKPEDLAGIKLRMPPGDAWQLPGRSLGANPTPMAYAETYTGLQTGAIDGQDNLLPNVQNMKFYEVMSQIVLTSHLVGFDSSRQPEAWNGDREAKSFRPPPTRRSRGARPTQRETDSPGLQEEGLDVYAPDVNVPAYAQKTTCLTRRRRGRRGCSTRSAR